MLDIGSILSNVINIKWIATVVFHPFAFGAAAVLAAWIEVKVAVLPEECLPALWLIELGALAVFALCWALLRNIHKAGIITSALVAWFFSTDALSSILAYSS